MKLGEPVVVAVGPPEMTGPESWGFFQFPDLWRGRDGDLYLVVNVGADSRAGRHEPSLFFHSPDGGRRWEKVQFEQVDCSPEILDLPDGRQVAFGEYRRIYAFQAVAQEGGEQAPRLSAIDLGLKPVMGPFLSSYKVAYQCHYRYGDVPEDTREFPVWQRPSADAPWERTRGQIEMDGLLLRALVRDGWDDEEGKFVWKEFAHEFSPPVPNWPNELAVGPDGAILWVLAAQSPEVSDRQCWQVLCLASEDGGCTWRLRGMITEDLPPATWGYGGGEQSLALMPNGDLLCVMRTKMSNEMEDTHHLAAARSTDGGHSWIALPPISEFSVTPFLVPMAGGAVAVLYGRPGVHVRISTDSGTSWSDSMPIVGPPEAELTAMPLEDWWKVRHEFSCANLDVAVTGPDRFLVAYSDFQHENADGRICKAIKVREISVG